MKSCRRRFIRNSLVGAAALGLTDAGRLLAAETQQSDPWLRAIASKKRKAFFDVMEFFPDGTPFRRAGTLLRVMSENYQVPESDMGLAIGMHSRGLAHLISAAAWDDLGLTEWLAPQLNGPSAAALADGPQRFATANGKSVAELRARGVRVLACQETIGRWAERIATLRTEPLAATKERITRALHAGVDRVPAMVAAAVMSQESGAVYVAVA
jgi:intracellular sulfur oxidation DsrE/DsrF family protein